MSRQSSTPCVNPFVQIDHIDRIDSVEAEDLTKIEWRRHDHAALVFIPKEFILESKLPLSLPPEGTLPHVLKQLWYNAVQVHFVASVTYLSILKSELAAELQSQRIAVSQVISGCQNACTRVYEFHNRLFNPVEGLWPVSELIDSHLSALAEMKCILLYTGKRVTLKWNSELQDTGVFIYEDLHHFWIVDRDERAESGDNKKSEDAAVRSFSMGSLALPEAKAESGDNNSFPKGSLALPKFQAYIVGQGKRYTLSKPFNLTGYNLTLL